MARKQIGTTTSAGSGWCGPWVDGNDNVYVLDGTGDIYKAGSDPLVDSWSAQDSSNKPANVSGACSGWQDGTQIHVVTWDTTAAEYNYSIFRTSDHASADTWDGTVTDEQIELPAQAPSTPYCYILVRSDGDIIVFYAGDKDGGKGGPFDRADYARRESGSWTVGISVDTGGTNHRLPLSIGISYLDVVVFVYSGPFEEHTKELSSGYTLGGEENFDIHSTNTPSRASSIGANGRSDVFHFCGQLDSGTSLSSRSYTVGGEVSSNYDVEGTDVDNPSYPHIISDGTSALFLLYRSGTDDDIKMQQREYTDYDDDWGTIQTVSTATAPSLISANYIDHGGGGVAAVVYLDTNVYYDEVTPEEPSTYSPHMLTVLGVG